MPNLTPPSISSSKTPMAPIGGGEAPLTSREAAQLRALLATTSIWRTAIQNGGTQFTPVASVAGFSSDSVRTEASHGRPPAAVARFSSDSVRTEASHGRPPAAVARFSSENPESQQSSRGIDSATEEPSVPLTTRVAPRPADVRAFVRPARQIPDVFLRCHNAGEGQPLPRREEEGDGMSSLPMPTCQLARQPNLPPQLAEAFPMSPLAIRSRVFLKKLFPTYPIILFKKAIPFHLKRQDPNTETPAERLKSILFNDDFLDTFQLVGCCEQGDVGHANSFRHLNAMATEIKSLTDHTVQIEPLTDEKGRTIHQQRFCMLCKAIISGEKNWDLHVDGTRHRRKADGLKFTNLTFAVIREEKKASAEIDRWLSSSGY